MPYTLCIRPYYMWQYYHRNWPWSYTVKYGEIRRNTEIV
jgi:hypothetical protein